MNYLSQQSAETFSGKRVVVRLDLNVPIGESGHVVDTDADRIKKSLDTIQFLKNAGARVIVVSHIGRERQESLRPVVQKMEEFLTVGFVPHLLGDQVREVVDHMSDGQVVVLENLRSDAREESNDEEFARELAAYGDLYVNDAFAVSHRNHASIVTIPKLLPSYAGFQMEAEIENLSQAFNPPSPSILVLGGAKFETKLPVIQKFLPIVDHIIIGGALANNVFKAKGYEVGKSLIDADASIGDVVDDAKIIVPNRVVVENEQGKREKDASEVASDEKIVDIAPSSFDGYADLFASAQFVVWNGPMGNYENGFTAGSAAIAKLIAESPAQSIVGGGDSVALIEQMNIAHEFGFVSTGGGAMLEYLAQGTLPGIEALEQ